MKPIACLLFAGCASLWAAVNPVEPLSNGLALSMTRDDVVRKFGQPTERGDARALGYGNFAVQLGGRQEIQRVVLKKLVRLSCGIGPGSSRDNVIRTFGAPFNALSGQYSLTFSYTGDRVASITIQPANGRFAPLSRDSDPVPHSMKGLPGTWYGTGTTAGLIEIHPDGTYKWNDAAGRWAQHGNQIVFTGPLEEWNHGHAVLKDGSNMEFSWSTPDGAKQDFTFAKLL